MRGEKINSLTFDPRSRPTVTAGSHHYFRTSVRPPPLFKVTHNETKFNRDCGSGRVDHWWHTCLFFVAQESILPQSRNISRRGHTLKTAHPICIKSKHCALLVCVLQTFLKKGRGGGSHHKMQCFSFSSFAIFDPLGRLTAGIVFTHVVSKSTKNITNFKWKQCLLLVRLWVWPSGS